MTERGVSHGSRRSGPPGKTMVTASPDWAMAAGIGDRNSAVESPSAVFLNAFISNSSRVLVDFVKSVAARQRAGAHPT
ncbi:hypothetical protein ACHMW7_19310 [Aminobacter sp. UC22_36]|uniref:hypothetical protein n=1 Tax=Aminobacter sp. UC22_36 TaxID=3374549 RepID=UPI0037568EF7